MSIREAMKANIVFYMNKSLNEMIQEVFKVHLEDDGRIFDNTEYTPTDIRIFTKEDYAEYDREIGAYPPNVDNLTMFIFKAVNGKLYLGCFNGKKSFEDETEANKGS